LILAAIDIGSNAIRLLISEAKPYQGTTDFTKLLLVRIPLRLGFDVFGEGRISEEKKAQLTGAMKAYRHLMDVYKVEQMRACATSAMRDAANSAEILETIRQETDIRIEVISGKEEAAIIYETHIVEHLSSDKSYMYIDVGGGSTEVTLFSKNQVIFKESFNIGTIRMLGGGVREEQWEHLKWFIKTHVKDHLPVQAIGSGGNINKVFSLSKRKDGKPLSLELLNDYYDELRAVTAEERMHLYKLRNDRADVIVPALQIYISLMRWAGADQIYVPRTGLADGLVRMLYQEAVNAGQPLR